MKTLLKIFFITFIFHFTICISAFAQNLVPNPSFENNIICPYMNSQLNFSDGWYININSSDLFDTCATQMSEVGIPINTMGYQFPLTGKAYAGFCAFNAESGGANFREFVGRELSSPLIIGQKYYITFNINLANNPGCASNKIGVLFTNRNLIDTFNVTMFSPNNPLINNFAHVYTENIISDTLHWVTVSGSFVADSAYKYFMIGNFFDDYHTDTIHNNNFGTSYYLCAYYYLDDVCISLDSNIGIKDYNLDDNIIIYPNPVINKLFIENHLSKEFIYIIYNSFGEKIKYGSTSHSNIEIDLSNFSSGIYSIQCFINNSSLTKKFILIN